MELLVLPEELQEWKMHPITQKLMDALTEEKERLSNMILDGDTIERPFAAQTTARYVGAVYGIDLVLTVRSTQLEE